MSCSFFCEFYHVRVPWPLCHTGSCCSLFCLFCSFWSFLAALLQCSPESGSNTFSGMRWCLSHAGCQGVQNVCFDEWVSQFWGDLKGPLPVYLIRKKLGIALRAETVLISLQPFQLLSVLDESWPPAPRFVNLKSNKTFGWILPNLAMTLCGCWNRRNIQQRGIFSQLCASYRGIKCSCSSKSVYRLNHLPM